MTQILILFLRLISRLPLRAIHRLGSVTGRLVYLLSGRLRHTTLTNIRLCFPEMDEEQQIELARSTLRETGKTLMELGVMFYADADRINSLIKIEHNRELHDRAMDSKRGLICLTPHIGCWEICNLVISQRYSYSCLYRPPRQQGFESVIKRSRERFGAVMVPTTPTGIKNMLVALKRGEMTALLPDQDPGKDAGIFADFFGVPCNTLPLVGRLLQKTGADALMVYALRLPNGHGYELFIEEVPQAMFDPDPVVSAQAMNAEIERIVRKAPDQYQWTYKRFKYQPDGSNLYVDPDN